MSEALKNFLIQGRLKRYLGLEKPDLHDVSKDYRCGYLALGRVVGLSSDDVYPDHRVKRSEKVLLCPVTRLLVNKTRLLIDVNPELHKLGTVGYTQVLEPGEELTVVFTARKDCDLGDLSYLIRFYMFSYE